jgi:CheY-like chemotaxis protein
MPGMTGSELARRIRRDWPSVPVVLASGYTELPGDGLGLPRLSKPYRQEELARLMASLVGPSTSIFGIGSLSTSPTAE